MTFSDTPWVATSRHNRLVVGSTRWQHGQFRLPVESPDFRDTGPIAWPTVVFAREPVTIEQADADAVIADANTVMVYNAHATYRREAISVRGDRCEWFSISPNDAIDVARSQGLDGDDPRSLFAFTHAPCNATLFRDQRTLANELADGAASTDPLALEEAVLGLFEQAISPGRSATQRRSAAAREPTRRAHQNLAEDAKYVLAMRLAERLTLDALADELDCSPFHLARTFRRWTGQTIHHYLTRLRLAAAMDLMEHDLPLREIALRTGFCRHSHLTKAFHDHVGMTPSAWRERPNACD